MLIIILFNLMHSSLLIDSTKEEWKIFITFSKIMLSLSINKNFVNYFMDIVIKIFIIII